MPEFPPHAFLADLEPLVRRILLEYGERGVGDVGANGKFIYLVRTTITESLIRIHNDLAATLRQRGSETQANQLEVLNEALSPYVDKPLLNCGIWLDGLRHEIYLDERSRTLIHRSVSRHPDPDTAANNRN